MHAFRPDRRNGWSPISHFTTIVERGQIYLLEPTKPFAVANVSTNYKSKPGVTQGKCTSLCRPPYHRKTAVTVARMLVEAPYSPCHTRDQGVANISPKTAEEANRLPWGDSKRQLAKSRHKTASKKPGASGRTRVGCSGDEVLRKHGGGYLLVATLCTLDRALSVESVPGASFAASWHSRDTRNENPAEQACHAISFKNVEAAHEVKELLVLLGCLLRLGSSGPIAGNGISDHHHGMSQKSNPPLVSEVDSALAAASPTSLRRRVSIDYGVGVAHQTPHNTVVSKSKRGGQGSTDSSQCSLIKVAGKKSEVPASVPVQKAGGYISPLLRQKGTMAASTYPAKRGKKSIPWSEPRRPSIDSTSASTHVEGSRRTGHGSGTYTERGNTSHLQTIDANEAQFSSAEDRMVRRRSLSSTSGYTPDEIASIVNARPGTSVEGVGRGRASSTHTGATTQRVTRSEFDKCGGGNFAVLLVTRWKRGSNDGEESGFTMLARLALGESLCPPCRSPPKERHWWWTIGSRSSSGTQPNSRMADIMGGKWRKGAGRYRGGSSSTSRMPEKRWRRRGTRKAATAGASSASWSEGAGETSPAETLAIMATEITRDYFLGQVRGGGRSGMPAERMSREGSEPRLYTCEVCCSIAVGVASFGAALHVDRIRKSAKTIVPSRAEPSCIGAARLLYQGVLTACHVLLLTCKKRTMLYCKRMQGWGYSACPTRSSTAPKVSTLNRFAMKPQQTNVRVVR